MDSQRDCFQTSTEAGFKEAAGRAAAPLPGPDILIVDDEAALRGMLTFLLQRNGLHGREAENAATARQCVAQRRPDLILLDWMLPDVSGLEYLRELKRARETCAIPVIMVSARAAEQDRVVGLESGADDYVSKPIASRELVARMRALLRRAARTDAAPSAISIGGLTLDPSSHRVLADGRSCAMGPTEYKLLEYFMIRPERVHSRQHLLAQIWGSAVRVSERTVDVHIRRLRLALQPFGYAGFVQTVHSSGYRFSCVPSGPKP